MKDIKNRLLNELESYVPKMSEELKNYPITVSNQRKKFPKFSFMLGALACLIILAIILPFTLNKKQVNNCYLFAVNPTIMVVTDSKGNVTEIKGGNSDADELLIGLNYKNLIGENIEDVSIEFMEQFIKLGYFDSSSHENIIKISSSNSNFDISKVINSYANNKGYFVAVLSENLEIEKFNNDYNLDLSTIEDVADYIMSLEDLTLEYEVVDSNYSEIYKEKYLKDYLTETILKDINRLENNRILINDINSVYEEIANISKLKDYWIIKNFYEAGVITMSDELKALVEKMDVLLEEYNSISTSKIESTTDLKISFVAINSLPLEELKAVIEELNDFINSFEFEDKINSLISLLRSINEELADKVAKYCSLPLTIEEYISQVKDIHLENYQNKVDAYKKEYEVMKNPISKNEYEEYLNEIIDKYGSLENLWKNN